MKYVVALMFKDELKEYHFNLTKRISKEFDVRDIGKRIDPHITVKSLGDLENEELQRVEEILEIVCGKTESFEVTVRGIDRFNIRVIFLDVLEDRPLRKFYENIYSKLMSDVRIPVLDKFEGEKKRFHSSVASRDIKYKIEEIVRFLKNEDPKFSQEFNSACILKRVEEGRWNLHREFRFGNG